MKIYIRSLSITLILLSGCAGTEEKSELLTLLGVDEEIVDTSNQDIDSTFDAISLLKRGEAHFVKENYIEAAAEFERFLSLHPFHRMAAFSQYKLALSHFHQMNTIDRDSAPMNRAIKAFKTVISQYPTSLYVDEAKEKLETLKRRQADHEFLIAHFYFRTKAYPAAIVRFNKILANQDSERENALSEKTLYYLGVSYLKRGDQDASDQAFKQLIEDFPQSPFLKEIKKIQPELALSPIPS